MPTSPRSATPSPRSFKNIETVVIRAQTTTTDATNGNNTKLQVSRSTPSVRWPDVDDNGHADVGVTRWESNNSRSDVVIEDVRIGNLPRKTSDVTIAMVETDPGNVDFGVYFDQHSLRNASSGTSSIVIQIMDTGAAAAAATAATPLLNNPLRHLQDRHQRRLAEIALNRRPQQLLQPTPMPNCWPCSRPCIGWRQRRNRSPGCRLHRDRPPVQQGGHRQVHRADRRCWP